MCLRKITSTSIFMKASFKGVKKVKSLTLLRDNDKLFKGGQLNGKDEGSINEERKNKEDGMMTRIKLRT